MKFWHKIVSLSLAVCLLMLQLPLAAGADGEPEITAEAAIIIEASTGRVVWEKKCRQTYVSCQHD